MAAPVYDASATNTPSAGTSHSWNHTVGAGSNRILLAFLHINSNDDLLSSVTFNGIAADYTDNANDGTSRFYAVTWLAPATGTHAIAVTTSGSCTLDGSSVSYLDANQDANLDFSTLGQIASNNTGLMAVDTTVNNCRVGMFSFNSLEVPTAGSGQTLRISDKDAALLTLDSVVSTPDQVYPRFDVSDVARWQMFPFSIAEVQGGGGGIAVIAATRRRRR
jgi:hypothetical protein